MFVERIYSTNINLFYKHFLRALFKVMKIQRGIWNGLLQRIYKLSIQGSRTLSNIKGLEHSFMGLRHCNGHPSFYITTQHFHSRQSPMSPTANKNRHTYSLSPMSSATGKWVAIKQTTLDSNQKLEMQRSQAKQNSSWGSWENGSHWQQWQRPQQELSGSTAGQKWPEAALDPGEQPCFVPDQLWNGIWSTDSGCLVSRFCWSESSNESVSSLIFFTNRLFVSLSA